MVAAELPCPIWDKPTLRVQSIARRSVAPFCRGERLQIPRATIPLLAAFPTLLRFEASEKESHKTQLRDGVLQRRVTLPHPRCVDALVPGGRGLFLLTSRR